MRVLHEVVIVGMALAFVSATSAFAGGKGGGGPTHSEITVTKPVDVATPKVSGSKTKGDKVQYLKYNFGTVFTTKSSPTAGGSTGPTKPPLPTTGRRQ
jgi:hypothetical protein